MRYLHFAGAVELRRALGSNRDEAIKRLPAVLDEFRGKIRLARQSEASKNGLEKIPYLLNREGRFFARVKIPRSLRFDQFGGVTELRQALGSDRDEAIKRLPAVLEEWRQKIKFAQQRDADHATRPDICNPKTLDQIIARDYLAQIKASEEFRSQAVLEWVDAASNETAEKIPNLFQQKGRFYARIKIPLYLREDHFAGAHELRRPLGGDRKRALRLLPSVLQELRDKIDFVRHGEEGALGPGGARHPKSLASIVAADYLVQIKADLELRGGAVFQSDSAVALHKDLWMRGYMGFLNDEELRRLVGNRIEIARRQGWHVCEYGSLEWRNLARGLCISSYEVLARQDERSRNILDGKPDHPLLQKGIARVLRTKRAPARILTFDHIIDAEIKYRSMGRDPRRLAAYTVEKFRRHAQEFAIFRNSDNALTVTAKEAILWRHQLLSTRSLANSTVKQKIQNIKTILNWARYHEPGIVFPHGNPLAGVRPPQSIRQPSHLRTYTLAEATTILRAARLEKEPIFRWIPFLCAYSGMRIGEAAFLKKEDFFQHLDRWYWEVSTNGGRSLKTASSQRRIPVHQALIAEGFMDFVFSVKKGPLFYRKYSKAHRIRPSLATWVRSLIPYLHRPNLRPNHGWRHLFEDLCRRDQMNEDARAYILGRSVGGSRELYGRSDIMLPGLAAAMDQVRPFEIGEQ
ncbi:integrase [Rhizobium leucaenae]|uniref:integrase n=1 Tax=Rhizobium leucaenae TaxID=29450 RepID=UPI0012EA38D9|nr:integrase [Rhizobium leucaenae]